MQVPDHSRRCKLILIPRNELTHKGFSLIIYGRSAADLQRVPCEEISLLAERYPDYHSSLFFLVDLPMVPPSHRITRTYSREKTRG